MRYVTDENSGGSLVAPGPGSVAGEREAVGEGSEDVPKHVLYLLRLVDQYPEAVGV